MKRQLGSVVKAQAGRDSGGFFAVVRLEEEYCFIADGKSRKLERPKRKNIKHLSFTNSVIDLSEITDKKLRTALKQFSGDEE
ncbi:MAG: KOW domain-containing RNA-binding protein [Ruminococcus sp.]|nr:KOW domain-containing RNA-binding protein [Ruminococcus sp.]